MKLFYAVTAVLFFTFQQQLAAQTNYYSQSTTSLNLITNWNTMPDGSGTAPANFTDNDQIFNIDETGAASIAAAWTVSGTGSKVVVGDGTNALIFSTGTFLVTATVDVANAATFNVQSNSLFTVGTLATGSTVDYSLDNTQSIRTGTYHNLTLSNASVARTKTATGAITVNGALTVNTNNNFTMSTFALDGSLTSISGNGTITTSNTSSAPIPTGKTWTQTVSYNVATQNVASGTYENLTISTTGTKTALGDITVNTTLNVTATLAMTTNLLSGTFTPTGAGTITTTNTSASPVPTGKTWTQTVQYNGASAQTIMAGQYQNLQINGGSSVVKTAEGNIAVPGTLTVAATTILDMATFQITSVGTYTNTGTTRTQNTSSTPIPSGKTIAGTFLYNATSAQTVVHGTYAALNLSGGDRTLSNLGNISISSTFTTGSGAITATGSTIICTGTTQTITLNGQTTLELENLTIASASTNSKTFGSTGTTTLRINGILEIQANRTMVLGSTVSLDLGMSATLSGTGTLSIGTTSATPVPSGINWSTFIVNYSSASNQTIPAGTFGRLIISGNGTTTASGDITVNDSLAMTAGTFALANNLLTGTITGAGGTGIGGAGTITTTNTSATPIPSGRTWTQTVSYAAAANQTIVAGTYANLQANGGSNSIKTAGGNLTVTATLTVAASTILDLATFAASATTYTNSGTIRTQNTSATPLTAGKTIAGTVEYNSTSAQNVVYGVFTNLNLSGGGDRILSNTDTIKVSGTLTMGSSTTPGTSTVALTGTTQTVALDASGSTFNNFAITAGTTKTITTGNLTVNGELGIISGGILAMGTFQLGGTLASFSGTGSITTGNTGATPLPTGKTWPFSITYNAATQTVMGGTYQSSFTIATAGTKTAEGNLTVNGTFSVPTTTILNMAGFQLSGSFTPSGTGTIQTQSTDATPVPANKTWTQTFLYNGGSSQNVMSGQYVALTLTGGGDRVLSNTDTIKVSGTLTMGTSTTPGTSTVALTGATTQTVALDASGSTFNNFAITAGTTKTITTGSLTIDGELGIISGGVLAMGTFQLGGTLASFSGTGSITTANTSSTPLPTGKTWPFSVTYNAATQTVMAGTYQSLSIATAGTKTAEGNLTVNATFSVPTTTILNLVGFQLSGSFTPSGTGTIQTQNTGATPVPTGKTWTQTFLYNAAGVSQNVMFGQYAALTLTGGNRILDNTGDIKVSGAWAFGTGTITATGTTIEINGATTQTLTLPAAGVVFNNLNLSTGTVKTISTGPISVAGTLTIASGVTLTMGTNLITSVNTLAGTGTITTANTTAAPIPTGISWPYAVSFNANANQTIPAGTYGLGLSCTGTTGIRIKTLANDVTVGGGTLTINGFASIAIGAHTLTINAVLAQTGFITGGATSNIVIGSNASDAGSLLMDQSTSTTRTLNNFTLSRATGADAVTLGNPLRVIGTVTLTDGTLASNGNLTFVSTGSTTSAQLAEVTGTGNVSGDVIIQRYVVGRAAATNSKWRFLTSPVNTSTGIDDNWQQQIHITGPGTGGTYCPSLTSNSNGFDATSTGNASFYTWDRTSQAWVAISNTNATELETGKGYRVYVRGDRVAQACNIMATTPSTPNDVVLSATGTMAIGTQNFTCAAMASGYELIGNPFQATIDWEAAGVTKTNLAATIFGLKPDGTANGAYGSWNAGVGTNGMTQYISPGTSLWVQTNGAGNGSLSIAESAKVTSQGGFGYFKTSPVPNVFRIKLSMDTLEAIDEVALVQKDGASWAYDMNEDAKKFGFASNQLALNIPGTTDKYAICRVPSFDSVNNRLNIDIKTAIGGNYRLNFEGLATFVNTTTAVLTDTYTGTTQDVGVNAVYPFTTPDAASTSSGRFYITFTQPTSSLPVKLISLEGKRNPMKGTDLVWKTASEINSDKFEVERSTDAKTFETIGTVKASRLSRVTKTYTWTDAAPAAADVNYYRLKQYDRDGSFAYSKTIAVTFDNDLKSTITAADIKMYPVPVTDQMVIEVSSDKVLVNPSIRVYDMFGKLLNVPMTMDDGKWMVNMDGLPQGVYTIQLENNGETTQLKAIKN